MILAGGFNPPVIPNMAIAGKSPNVLNRRYRRYIFKWLLFFFHGHVSFRGNIYICFFQNKYPISSMYGYTRKFPKETFVISNLVP